MTQLSQPHKLSREEQRDRNAVLARESSIYNSPIITMKKPDKPFNTRDSFASEAERKAEAKRAAKNIRATMGEELTAREKHAKENAKAMAVAGRLGEREQRIEKMLEVRSGCDFEIGKELYQIQQEGDFAEKTFKLYIKNRWEKQRAWAYKLIDSYRVIEKLPENVSHGIQNTKQALALKAAEPEQRAEIFSEVAAEGEVTAKKITEKIKEKKREAVPVEFDEVVTDKDGKEIPKKIVPEFLRAEKDFKEHIGNLQSVKNWLEDDDKLTIEVRQQGRELIKDLLSLVKTRSKYVLCPKCAGKKCKVCNERGFVSNYFATKGIGKEE